VFGNKAEEDSLTGDLTTHRSVLIRWMVRVIAMENLIPGGSAVLVYDSDGCAAIMVTEYLRSNEGLVSFKIRRMLPLASFFDEFLECKSGVRGMYYEAVRERLLFPTLDGEIRAMPFGSSKPNKNRNSYLLAINGLRPGQYGRVRVETDMKQLLDAIQKAADSGVRQIR
jgi:hypothetical protein